MSLCLQDSDNNVVLHNAHFYESLVAEFGSPLLLLDCNKVKEQFHLLQQALPMVTLHYALKPLPHKDVVATLFNEGASFDLASSGEINIVKSLNIPAEYCIHTHPIKTISEIEYALAYGISTFVVDNLAEIDKFIPYADHVELLVRVSFRNNAVFADLSKKFGCQPQQVIQLISHAHKLGIRVKGLSFHVGSQTLNPQNYVDAITACHEIILAVTAQGLPSLNTLDIGGGFPVNYAGININIDTFCQPIREALAKLPDTIRVLAEPGRYIVATAMEGVCSVIGKAVRDNQPWYYLDDGIYGSFSGNIFDHADYPLMTNRYQYAMKPSVLAGPTCDSIDIIAENILLPDLQLGDLIITKMLGAYSSVTATDFNFIKRASIISFNAPCEQAESNIHIA
jgi:ornithine decarboxylase